MLRRQVRPGVFFDTPTDGGGGAPAGTATTDPPAPPAPAPARGPAAGDPPEGYVTRAEYDRVGKQESDQARRAERRRVAKSLGLPEDTTQADLDGVLAALAFARAEAEQANTAALSELERRERAAAEREAAAQAAATAANDRLRSSIIRDAARDAGATVTVTGADGKPAPGTIDDVLRLVTIDAEFDPADETAYATAAATAVAAVRDRYPSMFTGTVAPVPGTPPGVPATVTGGGQQPPPGGQPAPGALERGAELSKQQRGVKGGEAPAAPPSPNPFA